MKDTIKQIIDRLNIEFAELKEGVREAWKLMKNWHISRACELVRDLTKGLIYAVEEIAKQIGDEAGQIVTGKEKKAALKRWLCEVVDIKYSPDFIEDWLISMIVDGAIDSIVKKLNYFKGRIWWQDGIVKGRTYLQNLKWAVD